MCLDGAEQYNHFKGLDANIEQVTGCDYVSVRFGFLPLAGYQELTLHYADDPYIVFMPCKQDKNGYWGRVLHAEGSSAGNGCGFLAFVFRTGYGSRCRRYSGRNHSQF